MNGLISMGRSLPERIVLAAASDGDPQPEVASNRSGDVGAPKAPEIDETPCPDLDTDGTGFDALAQWMAALNAVIEVPVTNAPVAGDATLTVPATGDVSAAGERAGRDTFEVPAFRSNQVMESSATQALFQAPIIVPVCYETAASPPRIAANGATDALAEPESRDLSGDVLRDIPRDATPVALPERIGTGTDATDRLALNVSPALESGVIPRTVPERADPRRPGIANASVSSLLRDMPAWQASPMNMIGAEAPAPRTERPSAEPVQSTGETLPEAIDEPALSATPQALRTEGSPQTPLPGARDAVTHMSTERWGPQLMSALGERIDVHTQLGVERAIIRLDPQSMGTLQIEIRRDGGALQIQFIASHEDVARQLLEVSHDLRQQLEGRQQGDVSVVVRHGHGLGQGGASPDDDADTPESEKPPGTALAEADVGYTDARFHLDDR